MEVLANQYNLEVFKTRITSLTIVPGYEITTAEEYAAVNAQMQDLHKIAKDVEAARKAELAPLKVLVDEVRDRYAPIESLCAEFKTTAQTVLSVYARKEAERVARERAEAERKHAMERAAAEQKAREELAAAKAKALKLVEAGNTEKADAVLAAADMKATLRIEAAQLTVPQMPVVTKLEGSRMTDRWVGSLVNTRDALTALVEDPNIDLDELVTFKQAGLNKLAAVYKDNMAAKYPGLVAIKQTTVSATGR
jgi:hypothetical protein